MQSGATKPQTQATPTSTPPTTQLGTREAARILGLKVDTVAGYVRSGRLPGHYRDTPGSCGWVTNPRAVNAYKQRLQACG